MIEKFQGIILNTVRHSDRASIVTVYTLQRGCMSLLVNVGSGKGARRLSPMLMPLAQVEFECAQAGTKELTRPRGLAFTHIYKSVYFSPAKSAVCFFIAEFLTRLLRQSEADPMLFRYISESLSALDMLPSASVANFHIVFLSGLSVFMGIAPDMSGYDEGRIFDLRDGQYVRLLPGHRDILMGDAAGVPPLLMRLNYANMNRLHLSRPDRAAVLDGLLKYWAIHFPGLVSLRSPDVLSALFD